MTPLPILQLNDDKPGHYHSADAVVAAARRLRPVELTVMTVARPSIFPPALLSTLVNFRLPPSRILSTIYGIAPLQLPRADLVVSSGGDTLAANVASARYLGVANIIFGSLRRFRPADFTLALNSNATRDPEPNQVTIHKPSAADPASLPPAPRQNNGRPQFAGLLVGGPAGTVQFSAEDGERLVSLMAAAHLALGFKWIVSNSRRTPTHLSDRLATLALAPQSPLEAFIDVRTSGAGTLGRLFRDAGLILVTADSSAMLSEAVWMRRPVISAYLQNMSLPAVEADYRRRLEAQGLCEEIPLANLDVGALEGALRRVKPIETNPLADLAEVLRQKLPRLFDT